MSVDERIWKNICDLCKESDVRRGELELGSACDQRLLKLSFNIQHIDAHYPSVVALFMRRVGGIVQWSTQSQGDRIQCVKKAAETVRDLDRCFDVRRIGGVRCMCVVWEVWCFIGPERNSVLDPKSRPQLLADHAFVVVACHEYGSLSSAQKR